MSKALSIALILCLCTMFVQYRTINTYKKQANVIQTNCDSIQRIADSLHAENFPCQIELSRYQRAYQIFLERNSIAASQYGTIISEETE